MTVGACLTPFNASNGLLGVETAAVVLCKMAQLSVKFGSKRQQKVSS
jgi:hypothetical protein